MWTLSKSWRQHNRTQQEGFEGVNNQYKKIPETRSKVPISPTSELGIAKLLLLTT